MLAKESVFPMFFKLEMALYEKIYEAVTYLNPESPITCIDTLSRVVNQFLELRRLGLETFQQLKHKEVESQIEVGRSNGLSFKEVLENVHNASELTALESIIARLHKSRSSRRSDSDDQETSSGVISKRVH
jgi:hypothetical protein